MPTTRVGPDSFSGLQEIADAIGRSKKVVVVTGAGISTNCGIPDFRSENGLYSLIQAQYDAALQNPPWEGVVDAEDIDDRPKKRRKPGYYYEVVAPCGEVVDIVDVVSGESTQQTRRSSRTGSTSARQSRSNSPRASSPNSSLLSDPPSERNEAFSGEKAEIGATPIKQTPCPSPTSRRSSRRGATSPSTASDVLSSPPPTPNSSQSRSTISVVIEVPSSSSSFSTSSSSKPLKHRSIYSLQREESSFVTSESEEETSSQSSQTSRNSLPNMKGRDMFDAMIWSEAFTTSIFYMFISSLRQKVNEVQNTTETHKFLKVLRDGGRLVRNYTQNIDRLEEKEGLVTDILQGPGNRARFHSKTQREPRPAEIDSDSAHCGGVEVVLLHGSLDKLRCGICAKLSDWDEERGGITLAGRAPDCPSCTQYNATRTGKGRRGLAVGRLRPDIVLYGEEHPQSTLISPLVTHDIGLAPDILLIMGTSLKVHGLKVMVREFAKAVHTKGGKVIFVNNTKPSESAWGDVIDYWVQWDCDAWVLDVKQRRSDIWLPQGTINQPRRESLADSKPKGQAQVSGARKKKYEPPRCTRDERTNGVYLTFKILDHLRVLEDENGSSTRRQYWEVKAPRISNINPNIAVVIEAKPRSTTRPPMQNLEKPKRSRPRTKAARPKERNPSRRIDRPTEPMFRRSLVAASFWDQLCQRNPTLRKTPPPISESIFQQRCESERSISKGYFGSTDSNHLLDLYGMGNLLTKYPPHGISNMPNMEKLQKVEKDKPKPPPTNHAYGTRSSRISAVNTSKTTVVVELPWLQQPVHGPTKLDNSTRDEGSRPPPTPPESNPSSDPPSENENRRIKRMGSIGAILSPIAAAASLSDDDADSDQSAIWHDALEQAC